MTKKYEYREVTEVWDGKVWVTMPSGIFSHVFLDDTNVEILHGLVANTSQNRKEHPDVGDFGAVYLERREVGQWEKL